MPKGIKLVDQHIRVEKSTSMDPKATEEQGAPVVAEMWTIIFIDKVYGDQIQITIDKETRDGMVRDLTGGIVLSDGRS